MSGPTWWQFRLRTLLIVVMLVAVLLGGLKTLLERRGRFIRNQGQVRAWTGQRTGHLSQRTHSGHLFRSNHSEQAFGLPTLPAMSDKGHYVRLRRVVTP